MDQRQWQGRSGGVLAGAAASGATWAHLSLRATSQGSACPWALAVGGLALTLALWPLAARATRVWWLTALLAAAQFGTHAVAVLATGHPGGAAALVCCPAVGQLRPGPLGALTAHAGWTLAAAQLVACVVLATVLRTARNGIDTVTQTLALVAALLGPAWARITAALRLLRTAPLPSLPDALARPAAKPVVIPARPELVGRWTRRGPPTARCSIRAAG